MQKLRTGWNAPAMAGALMAGVMALGSACIEPPIEADYPNQVNDNPPVNFDNPIVVIVDEDGIGTMSGLVRNWATNAPVSDVTFGSYGVTPPVAGSADANGIFGVDVAVASNFWMSTYKTGYAYTWTAIQMPNGDYDKDVYAVSETDIDAWATAFGVTQYADCGVVVATAKNNANSPQAGVDYLRLNGVDADGPYYFDALGQPYPTGEATQESGRAVFFNVCETGTQAITDGYDLQLSAAQGPYTAPIPTITKAFGGGVTVANISVVPGDGPIVEPEPEPVIDFPTEIMPIFTNYQCAACHAEGGTAAGSGLYFNVAPQNVYDALRTGTSRVNIQNPEASYVLAYPLIIDPPNGGHPNASWTTQDPAYQKLLQWVTSGAPYGVNPPPPLEVEVAFDEDVYPIFQVYDPVNYPYGRSCAGCHDAATYSGNLDLTGGPDVVFQRLVDKNLYNLVNVGQSVLLTKALGQGHGGGVQFVDNTDPDYQTIYQWIAQGAQYDVVIVPDPDIPVDVDFNYDMQYRFATNTCLGCHNAVDQQGGLSLEGNPYQVCQTAQGLVTADYAQSPLFIEPNAAYPDAVHGGGKPIANNDTPYALYLRGWIDEGYECDNAIPPVAFSTDIAPLFAGALNCTGCHNAVDPDGGLSLEGAPQEVYDNIVAAGALVAYEPKNSDLLAKPFDVYAVGNHPENRAVQTYYREFQVILDWVMEGGQYQ